MAHDFGNLPDLETLTDDELRDLVRERLDAHKGVDVRDVDVSVEDGVVRLNGRVGTEEERRIALRVVSDEIGVRQVENELVIDPIRRAHSPEAIDEHLVERDEHEGLLLGDKPVPLEYTTEHLSPEIQDEVQSSGTTDVQKTISHAAPWIPPERPTPEGMSGEDARVEDMGEDH